MGNWYWCWWLWIGYWLGSLTFDIGIACPTPNHELPSGKSSAGTWDCLNCFSHLEGDGVGLEVVVVGNLTYSTWVEWTGQTQFEATRSRVLSQDKEQPLMTDSMRMSTDEREVWRWHGWWQRRWNESWHAQGILLGTVEGDEVHGALVDGAELGAHGDEAEGIEDGIDEGSCDEILEGWLDGCFWIFNKLE